MVIDDVLDIFVFGYFERFFFNRINLNGCLIFVMYFVFIIGINYILVCDFYVKGMEIGLYSVMYNNVIIREVVFREVWCLKENLVIYVDIFLFDILGYRSLYLVIVGDD